MKSPFAKTLIMAVMALVTSAVAAAFYPWPEPVVVSNVVGKPLFESYDSGSVRSIQITEYNEEKSNLDRLALRRSGEKWIIPDFKNFVATNSTQIALAANCLIDREVLVETTDQQEAYVEYGVVDPSDYQGTTNRSGLGKKIIIENRNGEELASLILGKPLKDDPNQTKHFVRVPGQPNVYVIDFSADALTTDFRKWVNPNLFRLRMNLPVKQINVENYRMDVKTIAVGKRELSFRAAMAVGQQGLQLMSVEGPDAANKWKKIGMTAEISNQLQVVAGQITNIEFTDVRKKSAELAGLFIDPAPETDASLLSSLAPLGFLNKGVVNGTYDFHSTGGEVTVTTEDGVFVTANIGSLAEQSDLTLNYFVLMTAGVDETIFATPKKPAGANEDAEKAYLRLVKERDDKILAAQTRAKEINQQHADWVYVVSQYVVEKIRPDVDVKSGIGKAPEPLVKKEEPKKEEPSGESAASKKEADAVDQDKSDQ